MNLQRSCSSKQDCSSISWRKLKKTAQISTRSLKRDQNIPISVGFYFIFNCKKVFEECFTGWFSDTPMTSGSSLGETLHDCGTDDTRPRPSLKPHGGNFRGGPTSNSWPVASWAPTLSQLQSVLGHMLAFYPVQVASRRKVTAEL